jgi:sulfonate transport system substrate-binding protein
VATIDLAQVECLRNGCRPACSASLRGIRPDPVIGTDHGERSMTGLVRLSRVLFAALLLIAVAAPAMAEGLKLRIGVQKYGTLVILQLRGTLAERLATVGVGVEWAEFPSGPPLLEALGAGSLDVGVAGEAPPVFAQAAGAPLLYIGSEPPAPSGEAILVAKESPIRTVSDLAGKRIALNKGSNVHYFLVAALARAGLKPADVTPVYLAPADARAAFERGSVDAWAIWDPYLAAAQQATEARGLVDGSQLVANRQFYLAHRDFVAAHPEVIRALIEAIAATDVWTATHPQEAAALLAPRTGLSSDIVETALSRLTYGVTPLDRAAIDDQQHIADIFLALGLIPKAVTVRDAVWNPQS